MCTPRKFKWLVGYPGFGISLKRTIYKLLVLGHRGLIKNITQTAVIELSGVQFGLKSYSWFQNRTSAQREFDLNSQVWFQTKIARSEVQLPLYWIDLEIAQFKSQICQTMAFLSFVFQQCVCLVQKALKSDWLFTFNCPIFIGWEKDAI